MRYFALALGALLIPAASARGQACAAPYLIEWPAGSPVWTMCWLPPDASSGPDGSGIELRHVFYKNRRVFWRANIPVLNVLYDPGGCGPTYRDWLNSLQPFDANNVLQPGYAEPTVPPKTVCDRPGADVGSFTGVAVEKLADRLILASQTQAGWYRYISKFVFHLNGTMEPQFGFTAVSNFCVSKPHMHHGYWRFDIDVEGAANDVIKERKTWWIFSWWSRLKTETSRLRTATNSRRWRVLDAGTGRGVEVWPGPYDKVGGDPFGGSDVWALRYRSSESDDGGSTGGSSGDAQHIDPYVNGEGIDQTDVVLWYCIGHRHDSGLTCSMVGPTLRLVGAW